jgi:hypothetical protein
MFGTGAMAEDLIRYDILAQDALRGMVRKVLAETARAGLPGEHHFFVTFRTRAPGVRISTRLMARYPEELTIVLQHQYRDLAVTEHAFEVALSFGGVPERLLVPFTAIKAFVDPSVQFALQFEPKPGDAELEDAVAAVPEPELPAIATAPDPAAAEPPPPPPKPSSKPPPDGPAQIVRLDAFRGRQGSAPGLRTDRRIPAPLMRRRCPASAKSPYGEHLRRLAEEEG